MAIYARKDSVCIGVASCRIRSVVADRRSRSTGAACTSVGVRGCGVTCAAWFVTVYQVHYTEYCCAVHCSCGSLFIVAGGNRAFDSLVINNWPSSGISFDTRYLVGQVCSPDPFAAPRCVPLVLGRYRMHTTHGGYTSPPTQNDLQALQ